MGKPVARVTDQHTCPQSAPAPHVGGPITGPGATTVLAQNLAVAVVGDAVTCTGGPPDLLVMGSPLVLAENKQVVCMGAPTAHGGVVVAGSPTVLAGAPVPPQVERLQEAAESDRPLCEVCNENNDGGGAGPSES